ncbi:MAG TPA: hypothetical protein VK140_09530 [Ktedonobacteraceae bacterium]|nr:hypothetical protein [Ktedonobacteraceae bacterium]
MIEVELKFEIPSESRTVLQAKLDALPFVRGIGHIDNSDTYVGIYFLLGQISPLSKY